MHAQCLQQLSCEVSNESPPQSVLIVVVEPDPYIRALQKDLLGSRFAAEFADDGAQALERARQQHPRLLIADILVPKVDGLSLTRQLKQDPSTRDISVLIFTELLAERRAREAGADAYVRKPLDERIFLAEVQRLLHAPLPRAEVT